MQDAPLVSVVIPTFNERNNVGVLLARLTESLRGMEAEVIFVDDSSDGTEEEIRRQETPLDVRVIHRPARNRAGGLSTAVLRGLAEARATYVCVMDGDLQHPPETIPALVERAQGTGADIVIASRHVSGGSSAGLDGPWRRFLSWAFGWVSRVLFYEKLLRVKDPLSGFFLVRRASLEGITLHPVGYKISLEVLIRAAGSHVEEVPYTFMQRHADETKARLGTGLQFMRHAGILLLEVPEVGRFWKFAFVGATGLLLYMAMLWALYEHLGVPSAVAWAAAAEAAVLSNFILNRNVTWFERRAVGAGNLVVEAAKYHVASAISVAANGATLYVLTRLGMGVLLAGAISVWVGVATSFLGAERFVFTTRRAVAMRRRFVPVEQLETPAPEADTIGVADPVMAAANGAPEDR